MNGGVLTNPMTNNELFWTHEKLCHICNQHPQSVASFFYEAMCLIGRAYAEALGFFKDKGKPNVHNWEFCIQDAVGYDLENWHCSKCDDDTPHFLISIDDDGVKTKCTKCCRETWR